MLSSRILYCCILQLCSCYIVFAQLKTDSVKLKLETLTINDGLSQGMVKSIIQDKDGFMWFATKDGLNKYNGYQITIYRNKPEDSSSLPDNYIKQLAEDDYGNFWIGTSAKGLCLFDRKKEKFYRVHIKEDDSQTDDDVIWHIECRKAGMLVVTGRNIYFFTNQTLLQCKSSIKNQNIQPDFTYSQLHKNKQYRVRLPHPECYLWMPDNSIWNCFTDSIFVCMPDKELKNWSLQRKSISSLGLPLLAPSYLRIMAIKGRESYLFQSADYMAVYNKAIHKLEYFLQNRQIVSSTVATGSGNFLMEMKQGNFMFDPYTFKWKFIIRDDISPHISGVCSFIDKTQITWIGTSGYGIIKFDERKQHFRCMKQEATPMFKNTAGNALFISKGCPEKLDIVTNKFIAILPAHYLENRNCGISFIIQDADGVYWMKGRVNNSTARFILSYNERSKKIREYKILNKCSGLFESLFVDSNKNVWMIFSAEDQYWRLRELDTLKDAIQQEFTFPVKNTFDEFLFVSDWWQDKNNIFWFGTSLGLFSLDTKRNEWHHWQNNPKDSSSLSMNMIFSLCPDPLYPCQYLWIGTNGGGLNRFEYSTGKFVHYSEKEGLPNNVVYGILKDDAANVWLSTNRGLSCFSPYKKLQGKTAQQFTPVQYSLFRNFTEDDGILGNEFNRYEFIKLRSGELIFGGVGGVTMFDPKNILKENPSPAIVLTGLTIFNTSVNYITHPDIIQAPIQYAKTITLPHDQNMFTIEFAGLQYSTLEKKKYAYILKGFNDHWIDNGNKNFASFTNLDPGEYVFHVTACNNSGIYNSRWASIKIIILPPWWGTWWFRSMLFLIIAGGIYLLYRYRLQQAIRLFSLRNRIASDLHDEIGSTLSSISISSTIIQNKMKNDTSETKTLLQQISSNTDNMMEAMSDIVWTINTKNDRFDNVISRMRAFATELLETKNCTVHFHADEHLQDIKLDMMQRKNFYLFYKEVLNNAAKYAECENVWIEISKNENGKLTLRIKDDGKGFDAENALKTNGVNKILGGNGLANMQLRAKELKGQLSVQSAIGKGTEVNLQFRI